MAEKQIPFQIKAIITREFATIPSAHQDGEEIGIGTGFNFGVDNENHAIAVLLDLAFECNETPFVILKIRMEFDIMPEAFEKFKSKKSKSITVPKGFLTHLAALAVSTSRGILYEKLKDTDFDFLLLPALNVSEILTDDMKFDM
ncbi:MAG: hypothetical protein CMB80_27080 [Flammeovirgaceae bacterium]|nr:hypothetical protein [Flammeovirgaceae bacterium]MBE62473.1 hypothetical protein [Flammeovirgaceae bacterium]